MFVTLKYQSYRKPILMQQTMSLVNSLNSFIREAVHSK